MFANVPALHAELLGREPDAFVSQYLFESVPQIFRGSLPNWVEWKQQLSDLIEVDSRDIVLTGSAAIGFSLNPKKGFKAFDDSSDIDCGIISPYHFEQAWRYLRKQRVVWMSLPRSTKSAIHDHRTRHVFSGAIATDWMLSILPFGSAWQSALELMSEIEPTKGRDVKLRIYKDFESLRHYQSSNIDRLRVAIQADTGDDETDIPITQSDDMEVIQ
jgi:hypothetical protein